MSLEDDKDELRRRVYAVLRHHRIAPTEVRGWVFLAAPKGVQLAELQAGAAVEGPFQADLQDTIRKLKIDAVSLDPFVKAHGLEENNNVAIDMVSHCSHRSLSMRTAP